MSIRKLTEKEEALLRSPFEDGEASFEEAIKQWGSESSIDAAYHAPHTKSPEFCVNAFYKSDAFVKWGLAVPTALADFAFNKLFESDADYHRLPQRVSGAFFYVVFGLREKPKKGEKPTKLFVACKTSVEAQSYQKGIIASLIWICHNNPNKDPWPIFLRLLGEKYLHKEEEGDTNRTSTEEGESNEKALETPRKKQDKDLLRILRDKKNAAVREKRAKARQEKEQAKLQATNNPSE